MVNDTALVRLLHLVSPSLPTGAFAYSQGLEWAIEAEWIKNGPDLQQWLMDVLNHAMPYVDLPLLLRMYAACRVSDETALEKWCHWLLACRETNELRQEEINRGKAMGQVLRGLCIPLSWKTEHCVDLSQLAGFALAAAYWDISPMDGAIGYFWSWLENQVMVGIKTIPLGQTEGHVLLARIGASIPDAVNLGFNVADEDIGASMPSVAIAYSLHETQYTRIYRS